MGVWRCPHCGSVVTLEARFGEILAVYDLCAVGGDARAGRGPVRMEPLSPEVNVREPELAGSRA